MTSNNTNTFRVVLKRVGQEAEVLTYNSVEDFSLPEIQKLVGGIFEANDISFNNKYFTVYSNENAIREHLRPNIVAIYDNHIYDTFKGDVIILSSKLTAEGLEVSLTDEEINKINLYCLLTDIS